MDVIPTGWRSGRNILVYSLELTRFGVFRYGFVKSVNVI
jgi:hypothetical protein